MLVKFVQIICMCVWSELSTEYEITGYCCQFYSWSAEHGNMNISLSRSRLNIWSHEMGSVVLSRVSLVILPYTQADHEQH